jgi:hypothetical protein
MFAKFREKIKQSRLRVFSVRSKACRVSDERKYEPDGTIKLSETKYSLYSFLNEIGRNMVIKLWHPHKVRTWISDVIFRYLFLC